MKIRQLSVNGQNKGAKKVKITSTTNDASETQPLDSALHEGSISTAIQDYSKAIELNPNMADTFYNRGCAYIKQGSYSAAIQDFSKTIELYPNLADAYHARGYAYVKQSNYPAAIRDLNKAIELNPHLANAFYERGRTYGLQSNYPAAVQDLSKAIELNPNLAHAYFERARAYGQQGNHPEAIQNLSKTIELKPNNVIISRALESRIKTHRLMGNEKLALEDENTLSKKKLCSLQHLTKFTIFKNEQSIVTKGTVFQVAGSGHTQLQKLRSGLDDNNITPATLYHYREIKGIPQNAKTMFDQLDIISGMIALNNLCNDENSDTPRLGQS